MAQILPIKPVARELSNLEKSLALVAAYNQAVLAARSLQKPSNDMDAL